MKYAHINAQNKLLGWYDNEIHETIPTPNIEISFEQYKIAINNGHNKINNDGSSEKFDFRTQSELNLDRIKEIDAQLKIIDFDSVRPLRAITKGTAIQADYDKINLLDSQADALRTERANLAI